MVDIFDEVDEDLRAERMMRFARRYGAVLIGCAVLVVIGVAGWEGWSWYRGQQNARAATAFVAALDQAGARGSAGTRGAIAGDFATIAASAPAGYKTLARLNEASLLADSGQMAKANSLYDGLMNDPSVSGVMRDVATLGWASHALATAEPSLIQARLGPLAGDGNAWRPIALQYLGLLDIRTGDKAGAIKTFQSVVNDVSTPSEMRNMASAMVEALGGPPPAQ